MHIAITMRRGKAILNYIFISHTFSDLPIIEHFNASPTQ